MAVRVRFLVSARVRHVFEGIGGCLKQWIDQGVLRLEACLGEMDRAGRIALPGWLRAACDFLF